MSAHHRRYGAAVLGTTLALAGCGGNAPRPGPTTSTTVTTSTSPPTSAPADPARRVVPLDGDRDLRFTWTLDAGVDPHDPVIDVARRTIVLIDLGYGSPSWTDRSRITKALSALTTGHVVTTREVSGWAERHKSGTPGVERVLVAPPAFANGTATVFACRNVRGMPAIHGPEHGGSTTRIELVVDQGAWRVSSYDNNQYTSTAFEKRCDSFG